MSSRLCLLSLVRSKYSEVARLGSSVRASLLGDRLLLLRLSSALCLRVLVRPGSAWSGTGRAGQPVVGGTDDSGREWLVWVEGGAGHPESQLVLPSEEREPRPPPVTCVDPHSPGRPADGAPPARGEMVCRQSSQWL